ncbi:MAG: tRNA (adenosine(37)-N6)-threonylcarbamoyltransferase complex dimerization subunit type 1 TsaB [Sphingomonadaceae bacterium]
MELVIDSATAACSAALVENGRLLAERHEIVGRGHAERLAPMVEELLAGETPHALLVDCGPGSFTGVRVGLAFAHGLAIGWGLELNGFSSLALIAAGAGRPCAAAIEGGHGEIFVQSFAHDPLRPTDSMRSLSPRSAAEMIESELLLGSGAETLRAARSWGTSEDRLPRAGDALLLPPTLRSLPPRPIYGRAPDASLPR